VNQLLLGASIPFAVAAVIYAARRCRAGLVTLILTPALMLASALWAVAPDLPRLLGHYDLYQRLSRDPRCDLFLFHYTIDLMEADSRWCGVGLVLMAGAILAAALRELRTIEQRQRRG
jgi:hypothetical protein